MELTTFTTHRERLWKRWVTCATVMKKMCINLTNAGRALKKKEAGAHWLKKPTKSALKVCPPKEEVAVAQGGHAG
jgi:hypothetical protein